MLLTDNGWIAVAKQLADDLGQKQIILCTWDGTRAQITTYGRSVHDSDQAAEGGDRIKTALGWPENLRVVSPKNGHTDD